MIGYRLTLKLYSFYNDHWDSPNLEYRLWKMTKKWFDGSINQARNWHIEIHSSDAGRFMKDVRR